MAVTSVPAHSLKTKELVQVFDDIYVVERVAPLQTSDYLTIRLSKIIPWNDRIEAQAETLRLMLHVDTKVHIWHY